MKLETPFGCVHIHIDGIPAAYVFEERQQDPRWYVDGRYWIRVPAPEDRECHTIACIVSCPADTNVDYDSGEGVEMVSFRRGQLQMEIGIHEANDDHGTETLSNGISYTVHSETRAKELVFGVAWLCRINGESGHHTWFSCDPTVS